MVRWRYCLVLAVLLLIPTKTGSKSEDDEEEDNRNEDEDNGDDSDDDDDDEETAPEKPESVGRRAPPLQMQVTRTMPITRTTKKRPLECYVCAYKPDTLLRACLDPAKYRVHTITCHSVDDKCFTSVIAKGNSYETVVRGCRSGCLGSPETTCCELNRCNNQAFAMPNMVEPRALVQSKATKCFPSSVLFFVTILLVLQTVVKVTFV